MRFLAVPLSEGGCFNAVGKNGPDMLFYCHGRNTDRTIPDDVLRKFKMNDADVAPVIPLKPTLIETADSAKRDRNNKFMLTNLHILLGIGVLVGSQWWSATSWVTKQTALGETVKSLSDSHDKLTATVASNSGKVDLLNASDRDKREHDKRIDDTIFSINGRLSGIEQATSDIRGMLDRRPPAR